MSNPGTNTINYSYDVDARIRFDPLYIKTKSGILKVTALITILGGLISVASTSIRHDWEGDLYNSIAGTALSFNILFLLLYVFHVCEKFHKIPFLKMELLVCTVFAIAFVVCSITAVTHNRSITVVAIFGFCSVAVYAIETGIKGKAIKAGEIAQGQRIA